MPLSTAKLEGPWSHAEVEAYLGETAIPIRLGVISPSGWPMVLSLWFLLEDGYLLCATQESAAVVTALRQSDRCAFEVAGESPPYSGVRGRGRVELDRAPAERVLNALIRRYLGSADNPLASWLLSRLASEVCIRVDPVRVTSWDYRTRMGRRRGR